VGKDPLRLDRIAVRVAPASLDLWRAGILPLARSARSGPCRHRLFHTGLRPIAGRAGRMPGTDEPSAMSIARIECNGWELLSIGNNNAWMCGDLLCDIDVDDITHWMPLPKPPTKTTSPM
jgi:hypothetical protein